MNTKYAKVLSKFPKTEMLLLSNLNISLEFAMFRAENCTNINFGNSLNVPANKVFSRRKMQYNVKNDIYKIDDNQISTIVVHTTSLESIKDAVDAYHNCGVSSHCIIDQDGLIYLLVPFELCAFHAGVSYFGKLNYIGIKNHGIEIINSLNPISIGIEFLTPNIYNITNKQIESYQSLLPVLARLYDKLKYIISHSTIATDRKEDPSTFINYFLNTAQIPSSLIKLPYKLQDKDLMKIKEFFQEPEKYDQQDVYNLGNIIELAGYKILWENYKVCIEQIINAICDYIKHYDIDLYYSSCVIKYHVNKLQNSEIMQYFQRFLSNIDIDVSNLSAKYHQIYSLLITMNSYMVKNLINQMNIDEKIMQNISALQNQRIINENIIQLFIE